MHTPGSQNSLLSRVWLDIFPRIFFFSRQNSAKTADGSHLHQVSDEEMQVLFLKKNSFCKYGKSTNYSEKEHFDNFFEDCFVEAEDKYGDVEEMNVCDNLGDHLVC